MDSSCPYSRFTVENLHCGRDGFKQTSGQTTFVIISTVVLIAGGKGDFRGDIVNIVGVVDGESYIDCVILTVIVVAMVKQQAKVDNRDRCDGNIGDGDSNDCGGGHDSGNRGDVKALKVMVRLLMMVLTAVISALSLAIEVMVVSLLCCRCRLDIDQAARKNAQDFFKINDPDYYEFEGSNVQCLHLKDRCSNV